MLFQSRALRPMALLLAGLAVLALQQSSVAAIDQSHISGVVGPYDRLLFAQNVNVPAKVGQVVVQNINFPAPGHIAKERITCIKILDQWRTGFNAYPFLNSGGVGQQRVSISLRSQLNRGISYVVQVFGR